jgi:hypothetical protein
MLLLHDLFASSISAQYALCFALFASLRFVRIQFLICLLRLGSE